MALIQNFRKLHWDSSPPQLLSRAIFNSIRKSTSSLITNRSRNIFSLNIKRIFSLNAGHNALQKCHKFILAKSLWNSIYFLDSGQTQKHSSIVLLLPLPKAFLLYKFHFRPDDLIYWNEIPDFRHRRAMEKSSLNIEVTFKFRFCPGFGWIGSVVESCLFLASIHLTLHGDYKFRCDMHTVDSQNMAFIKWNLSRYLNFTRLSWTPKLAVLSFFLVQQIFSLFIFLCVVFSAK